MTTASIHYFKEPRFFKDARGSFHEVYHLERMMEEIGEAPTIQQVNVATSHKGVFRGLHFQNPRACGKFVTCISGRIWDVVVDIRLGSPTFKRWWSFELTGHGKERLWVPRGFAHGYYATEDCQVLYAQDECFNEKFDRSMAWDDPDLAISYPFSGTPMLSDKDRNAPKLKELQGRGPEALPRPIVLHPAMAPD
jgi:dTDP-4-dehydrorhamnose 3,5-epimerase